MTTPIPAFNALRTSATKSGAASEGQLLQYPSQWGGTGEVSLLANTTYVLSYWVRTTDTIGANWGGTTLDYNSSWSYALVSFYNASLQWVGESGRVNWLPSTVLPDWTQMSTTFTTPANTVCGFLQISCHVNNNGAGQTTMFIDDVAITRTEPSLNNTGFENSTLAPWTADGGGGMSWAVRTTNPHFGSRCVVGTGGSTSAYEGKLQWADKPVYSDTGYRFSLWVRNTGTDWGAYGSGYDKSWFKAVAQEADASGNWGALGSHDLTPVETSMSSWTRLGTDFTTSPTTTQVRIIIKGHLASAADTVAFDDTAFTVTRATKVSWIPFDVPSMRNAITAGADVVGIPVQDISSAYYPSAYTPPSPIYGDGSVVREAVQYAHDRGVLLEAAIPPCMNAPILTAHPEWRRRYTDSTYWLTIPADQATGCLVSPYGDFLIDEVKEVAQLTGADGITFDGYNYLPCYCDYCKAKFLADTGHSLPATINYDDPIYREYILWQDAQITDHLARMKAAVRAIYPKFEFYIWSTNAGRYGHYLTSPRVMPVELNQQFDCSMQEWWADQSNIGLSIVPDFGVKYLGAVSRGTQWLSEPYLFTHPNDVIYASSMPEEEVQFRMFDALSAGAVACYAGATEKTYMIQPLFAAIDARRPWTHNAQAMPWAAMLVSEQTRQFYGRGDPVNLYINNCFGYFAALLESHIPVDLVTHTDLRNGLAPNYKVLIMPNAACLSSADITAVRSFVSAGGGLVATGATSLYDEQGVARANYALGDLFKASKTGSKVTVQSRVTLSDTLFSRNSSELGRLLSPTGRTASFAGEVFPAAVTSGGTPLASVCANSGCTSSYPLYVANSNPGGGRVVFLPACIDAGYFKSPYNYEATVLKDAVMWAANCTPPVTIVGPKSLQVTYFTQNNGKRLVIHLLNATISTAGRASATNDVPVRDEVVPLRNIEVWFENATPTSVSLQPDNIPLALYQQGGRTRVTVSELRQHSMVVADIP